MFDLMRLEMGINLFSSEPAFSVDKKYFDYPKCEEQISRCYQGSFKDLTSLKSKKVTKIEVYNEELSNWENIEPEAFDRLTHLGLTEERLNQLNFAYAKWKKVNWDLLDNTFTGFIEELTKRIDSTNLIEENYAEDFWELVDLLNETDIYPFTSENQCLFKKDHLEHALVLESFDPEDKVFSRKSIENLASISTISRVMNVCTKTFSSVEDFCSKIKDYTKTHLTKLIMIKAHGNEAGISVYSDKKKSFLGFGTKLSHDCFEHVDEKSTVVVDACESGYGGASFSNFANFLANRLPKNVHIIAPKIIYTSLYLNLKSALPESVVYTKILPGRLRLYHGYHIHNEYDDKTLCPRDELSLLNRCTPFPILDLKNDKEGNLALYFFSKYYDTWLKLSDEDIQYFKKHKFNNQDLYQLSFMPILDSE